MLNIEFIGTINAISSADWDACCNDCPFTRHAFLHALETSASVGGNSGWQARHILVFEANELIGVMPSYIKSHSWGEYVFDWSWAEAYQRNSLNYYPKLISAIPFTPASNQRLCCKRQLSESEFIHLFAQVRDYCKNAAISGWHILFPEADESRHWQAAALHRRLGYQYHWFNRGYQSFADFLAECTSRKRKDIRKERQRLARPELRFEFVSGANLNAEVMDTFYQFYQITYAKRSGHGGYLTRDFFHQIAKNMGDAMVLVLVYEHDIAIAGALNFCSSNTLYGRYWGCAKDIDGLHFETCYYRGIDYCIANKMSVFDAGAQGEHKIPRGFTPVETYSCHWLEHSGFNAAVAEFVAEEASQLGAYRAQLVQRLPFKSNA